MSNLRNILQSKDIIIPKEYEVFKNVYKHFRGKQVKEEGEEKVPGDPRPLLEKAEDFYLASPASGFMQADILNGVPSCWIAQDSDNEGEFASYISEKMMAMVLSSECDTELRTENSQSFVRLCPVYFESQLLSEQGLKEGDDKISNFKGNLKANNYTEYFWMPAIKEDGPLVADLSNVFSISLEDLHELVHKEAVTKVASLSQDAYFIFLLKTAWFFLRPSPHDTLRTTLPPLTE